MHILSAVLIGLHILSAVLIGLESVPCLASVQLWGRADQRDKPSSSSNSPCHNRYTRSQLSNTTGCDGGDLLSSGAVYRPGQQLENKATHIKKNGFALKAYLTLRDLAVLQDRREGDFFFRTSDFYFCPEGDLEPKGPNIFLKLYKLRQSLPSEKTYFSGD